ncbi:MAG TPA: hypothetical protein VKR23_07200 [Gaiellaceae bacterium]|nr:hypothetical protein [Gaiellaceae bacterium]
MSAFAVAGAASASPVPAAFAWFKATAAPDTWKHASPPSGGAVMWYPPSLVRLKSDSASVSAAQKDTSGRILVYLNATPRQGAEQLATWAAFRIDHNRAEDSRVRLHAQVTGLRFQAGARGSCVIDDYTTRTIVNHYEEIACFVQGRTSASVIVAAALQSDWARALPDLERAVSAFWVA